MPSKSQSDLEEKLENFLNDLQEDESRNYKYLEFLCNGFTFMNFRALVSGEKNKNIERMTRIINKTRYEIHSITKIYLAYKKQYQELVNSNEFKDHLLVSKSKKSMLIEEKIKQNEYFSNNWDKIEEAKEIYAYLNSVLAATRRSEYKLDLYSQGKYVEQWNFIELLHLLPSDELLDEKNINNVKQVFEIAFNFKGKELGYLLYNNLIDNIICDGDYICLASHDHTMLLVKENKTFILYDPLPYQVKPNTPEGLENAIKKSFFSEEKEQFQEMPIGITVFHKGTNPIKRANRFEVLQAIFERRESNIMNEKNNSIYNALEVDVKSYNGYTSSSLAVQYGHLDSLKYLLLLRADFNVHNAVSSLACRAVIYEQPEILKVLAEGNADLNCLNKKDFTPLILACMNENIPAIEALIECKADLNKMNHQSKTALEYAIINSKINAIKLLIEEGAQIKNYFTNRDYISNSMKAFITLQLLKKYITTHLWQTICPNLATRQLNYIMDAEKKHNNNWENVLGTVIKMAHSNTINSKNNLFFSSSDNFENYKEFFSSQENLERKIEELFFTKNISDFPNKR